MQFDEMIIPEIANPSAFKDDCDYASYCIYGVYDFYGHEFTYDSERGIVRKRFAPPLEKYRNYNFIYIESD